MSLMIGYCLVFPLCLAAFGADLAKEYYERLAKAPPRDAPAQVELAEWCQKVGLKEFVTECYQRAIAIDGDCEKARLALGYQRYGTGWIRPGEKPTQPPVRRQPEGGSKAGTAPTDPSTQKAPGPAATGATPPASTPPPAPPPSGKVPASPEGAPTTEPAASPGPGSDAAAPEDSSDTSGAVPAGGTGTEADKGGESPASADPATPAPGSGEPSPEVQKIGPKPPLDKDPFAAELEQKLQNAKAAGEKIGVAFTTYQDADFLIHTTLSKSSREMKTLLANLKNLKKPLATMIGAASSDRIWPDKLEFYLLKSEPEYLRFAEMVDGAKGARNPEGGYENEQEARMVLLNPDCELLPRFLGKTSLDLLRGSSRRVGWWLKEGIAERLLAQSPSGAAKGTYQKQLIYAADTMKAEGQSLKIFNLIESPESPRRELDKNRALAFSLVEFLMNYRRGGLKDLITALKSDKSPEPPATTSKEEESAYYVSYVSFQEEAIKSAFHAPVDVLDEKWKQFVIATGEKLRAQETKPDTATKKGAARKKG